jgi:hypothetical protein
MGILRAVLYFDVFRYPLTESELYEKTPVKGSWENFKKELAELFDLRILSKDGDFILGPGMSAAEILRRKKGNEGAQQIFPTALNYSRRIAAFPFVEGVFLSGGLSKNYFDEKGDIDYFIVCKPGRLWICRSLLVLRYKFLPRNKKKFWCTNYIISSKNLSIPDINAFTSTELAHLIPVFGLPLYRQLLESNSWFRRLYPNFQEITNYCADTPSPFWKQMTEKILAGNIGNLLEALLFRLTLKRWRKKYAELSDEDFDLMFRTRPDVCKRHSHGFQNKVLALWREKITALEKELNIRFEEA